MTELDEMQRYITNTGIDRKEYARYEMGLDELAALTAHAMNGREHVIRALRLAFTYGRAKGERHARATLEVRA